MNNRVDYICALELASHEALVRMTYKDSVGVLTWCVGMTDATGHSVERYINNPASLEHCMKLYVWALKRYAASVSRAFAGHDLTKAEFAAALSFQWNTGKIGSASWVKKWKAGDVAGAKKAFMNFRKPASIIGRRKKERDLFFDGIWSNDGTMTEITRLTKNMTPIWSSAKKINVEKELKSAFSQPKRVKLDHPSVPNKAPAAPTLSAGPLPPLEAAPNADIQDVATNKQDVKKAFNELRKDHSRTIESGDIVQKVAGTSAIFAAVSGFVDQVSTTLASIPSWVWPVAVIAVAVVVIWYVKKIKHARVDDYIREQIDVLTDV